MTRLHLSNHAEIRMRQRGFRISDIDLVFNGATRVTDDAYFMSDHDAAREIALRKREIQQIERLRGSKIIVAGGSVITLYHAAKTPKKSGNFYNRGQ